MILEGIQGSRMQSQDFPGSAKFYRAFRFVMQNVARLLRDCAVLARMEERPRSSSSGECMCVVPTSQFRLPKLLAQQLLNWTVGWSGVGESGGGCRETLGSWVVGPRDFVQSGFT